MKIVLFGYMGSGKTAVGKALARTLDLPFADLDDLIVENENKGIQELFRTKGEIYFRKIENQVLHKVLNSDEDMVLATGGGTPCYGDNLPFMISRDDVVTIFLRTSIAELAKRLTQEKDQRPLISHLEEDEALAEFIGKHLFERNKFYNQADYIVDTNGRAVGEVVEEIVLQLF